MARHPSAVKRHRQSLKRRSKNAARRSQLRTIERKLHGAIEKKDAAVAKDLLKKTVGAIMRTRNKGVMHKRTASRKVGRLSRAVFKATHKKS